MKLSWTFYPKGETESVTLTVVYIPELDAQKLPFGGFLAVNSNTAFVDWTTYKRFDTADVESRKDAYQQLTPINEDGGVVLGGKSIHFPKSQPSEL